MGTEIRVPVLGESVTEATVAQWFKKPGETVTLDEPLVELETDKVTIEVPAPVGGVLTEILVKDGETVEVGALLGAIGEAAGAPPPSPGGAESAAPAAPAPPAAPAAPAPEASPPGAPPEKSVSSEVSAPGDSGASLSPAVRRLLREHELDAANIHGTGKAGRLLKSDVISAMEAEEAKAAQPAPPAATPVPPPPVSAPPSPAPVPPPPPVSAPPSPAAAPPPPAVAPPPPVSAPPPAVAPPRPAPPRPAPPPPAAAPPPPPVAAPPRPAPPRPAPPPPAAAPPRPAPPRQPPPPPAAAPPRPAPPRPAPPPPAAAPPRPAAPAAAPPRPAPPRPAPPPPRQPPPRPAAPAAAPPRPAPPRPAPPPPRQLPPRPAAPAAAPPRPAAPAAAPPRPAPPRPAPPRPAPPPAAAPRPAPPAPPARPAAHPLEERVPMTRLRKTIAARVKEAQNTAAMLTTFNEVDMTNVLALRAEYKELFQRKHGISLGFMGFFVKACVSALVEIPQVNAQVDGDDIVYRKYCHVGVAIGAGRGLVVPVLRDAHLMSLSRIEHGIADFARRARDGKLKLAELQGGTFTISNGGVYGSLMSTPILNAPQSGILGMHKIQDRPVAREGQVVIRPMMYLALSYDHRIVDGREAVGFLVRVKENIEDPRRLFLDL